MKERTKNDVHSLKTVLSYIKPWRVSYGAGLLVYGADRYVQTAFIGMITGDLLLAAQNGLAGGILWVAATRIALFLAYILVAASGRSLYLRAGKRATAAMRADLYAKLVDAPYRSTRNVHSGELLSRLDNDVAYAGNLYTQAILQPLSTVLSLVLGLITVWSFSWKCALALAALGLLMLLVNILFVNPGRKRYAARSQSMAGTVTNMSDLLGGAETVRIYHNSVGLLQRYAASCRELYERSMDAFRLRTLQNTLGQVQAAFTLAASMGLGFWLFHIGEISLSAMPLLWGIGTLVVSPLAQMGNFFGDIQKQLAGAARVAEFLDRPAEAAEKAAFPGEASRHSPNGPVIDAENVQVRYGADIVLPAQSLHVSRGEFIALAGRSGSGKSSFLRALMGFEEYEGSLRLLGQELRDMPPDRVRALTSFLPQEPTLFDDSIGGNIRVGKPNATNEEIDRALEAAGISDFINSLPQGLDTQVGERGGQLSGGQKQRIALARALLKPAPILLMDEPTSALDSLNEKEIIQTLKSLKGSRTILVVTHSPALVQAADRYLLFGTL